ncbi:hypothetical protein M1203_23270 [Streptomyces sp. 35G-GA-8]|nr:hypothetical protein [Streptomyces sp. 35G-GA-8]MCL7379775.1 hypothetical protein [Streptomyces sp. 35G-GA-8]
MKNVVRDRPLAEQPAVVVHGTIHYTDFIHLAPVYFGIAMTGTGPLLAHPYLCAKALARPKD